MFDDLKKVTDKGLDCGFGILFFFVFSILVAAFVGFSRIAIPQLMAKISGFFH